MNQITKIVPAQPDLRQKLGSARVSVWRWRGEAQNLLAEAEQAVSAVLVAAKARDASIYKDFPQQVGPRYDLLRKLVKEGGALAVKGKCLRGPLDTIAAFRELRVHLCHGVQKLLIDEGGQWAAVFDLIDSDGKAKRWMLFEGEAAKLKSDLVVAVNAVVSNCAKIV